VDFSPFAWGAGLFAGFCCSVLSCSNLSLYHFFVYITWYDITRNFTENYSHCSTYTFVNNKFFRVSYVDNSDLIIAKLGAWLAFKQQLFICLYFQNFTTKALDIILVSFSLVKVVV